MFHGLTRLDSSQAFDARIRHELRCIRPVIPDGLSPSVGAHASKHAPPYRRLPEAMQSCMSLDKWGHIKLAMISGYASAVARRYCASTCVYVRHKEPGGQPIKSGSPPPTVPLKWQRDSLLPTVSCGSNFRALLPVVT